MKTVLLLMGLFSANIHFAQAQPTKKIPRIGYLAAVSPAADAPRKDAFRQALRDLGYIEGENIFMSIDMRTRILSVFQSLQPSLSGSRPTFSSPSPPMPPLPPAMLTRALPMSSWV
jgi:hypothetical protein